MFIATIIFFTSLFLLIAMIGARFIIDRVNEEHALHRTILPIKKLNLKMHQYADKIKVLIRFCNKKTFVLLGHFLVDKADHSFRKAIAYAKSKLPRK